MVEIEKPSENRKSVVVAFRLKPRIREALEKLMEDDGSLTLSEYVRRIVERHVECVKKDRSMLEASSAREVVQ